jgi:hypothetical protein
MRYGGNRSKQARLLDYPVLRFLVDSRVTTIIAMIMQLLCFTSRPINQVKSNLKHISVDVSIMST